MYAIVDVAITYDSTRAITTTKKDDREFWVKMYDLETSDLTFEEQVGGLPDSFIRLKEVEQNSTGKKYAFVYIDDGNFKMRYFDKKQRTNDEIARTEVDINKLIGINNFTMPIQGFADPFIVCTFITDDLIFIALFYNATLTHYHFIYDCSKRKIHGKVFSTNLQCTKKNFPYKSFYNDQDNMVYIFYRQGQAINVNGSNPMETTIEQMTDQDLGQMFLFNNKALIARSSSRILFFK